MVGVGADSGRKKPRQVRAGARTQSSKGGGLSSPTGLRWALLPLRLSPGFYRVFIVKDALSLLNWRSPQGHTFKSVAPRLNELIDQPN